MSSFDTNLKKRMDECRNSDLDPEMVTPATAGCEELPEYTDNFPLVKQFKETNGGGRYSLNTKNRKSKE